MFGCLKEPSHRDGSFEYPQCMFWLRNKKTSFQLHPLIWGPDCLLTIALVTLVQCFSYNGRFTRNNLQLFEQAQEVMLSVLKKSRKLQPPVDNQLQMSLDM